MIMTMPKIESKRDGELLTIEKLVTRFYPMIFHLARSILDDEAEAQDAAQETFIISDAKLSTFRGDASPKTWLYSIGLNVCRAQLRKRKRRERLRQAWQGVQALVSRDDPPEQKTQRNERDAALWAAVDALPEKQRLPIILRYVHGLSTAEIGAVLEISEGTVHSRLYYARTKLQGVLRRGTVFCDREGGLA